MLLEQFEILKITFKMVDGQIVKEFSGVLQPKDYENIEVGLATVIEFITRLKQLPSSTVDGDVKEDTPFTIIFKKDVMDKYFVETIAISVIPEELENILSGLMLMQIKIHMEKMVKKKIKMTLKHDNSIGVVNFSTDEQLR